MMWSRLLSWLSHSAPKSSRPRLRSAPRHRLRVEILEDRTLLSTVTTLMDDGTAGSLRGAIAATPAGGTVDFAPGLTGTIRLLNTLQRGSLTITKNLTVAGPANAAITVSGDQQVEVFAIVTGNTVTIRNLTVRDGVAADGGGIRNEGTLAVDHVTLAGNFALLAGAGIYNTGTLTVSNSTITGNSALVMPGGGGLYNAAGATTHLINVTVAGNTSMGAGGGLLIDPGMGSTVTLANTVVANNTAGDGPDIKGAVTAANNSLLKDPAGSTGVQNGVNGNIVGVDPRLGPLQNNGGPTFTMAPLLGSPVIDAGSNALAMGDTDQRGFRRIVGGTVDMGAFEYQPPETTLTVTSSAGTSVFGQTITFSTEVHGNATGSNTPTGTVDFVFDGGTPGVRTVSQTLDANGRASVPLADLPVGTHTVAVHYLGDFNFTRNDNGTLPGGLRVDRAQTRTTLISSLPGGSVTGQPVTFTATVAAVAPGGGIPSGMVNFVIDGGTPIAKPVGADGKATLTVSDLTARAMPHVIVASYVQSDNFAASASDPLNQQVNRANTQTRVTSSLNPSGFGQDVTFSVDVTALPPGGGTPSGTVDFVIQGIGTVNRPLTNGHATYTTNVLTIGTHTVVANYLGTTDYAPSSDTLSGGQQVISATRTVVTSSLPGGSVFGQAVTFTAEVTAIAPGTGTPAGMVNFIIDGGTPMAKTLDGMGKATLTVSDLGARTMPHTIVVNYLGNPNYAPSMGSVNQQVNRAQTRTTLISSLPGGSVFGQPVTFTATVTIVAPGAGSLQGGMVNFVIDGGMPVAKPVGADGKATLTVSDLGARTTPHVITASYVQSDNFAASSSDPLNQQVNRANTQTLVTSSANPSAFGQAVTFTAAVTAMPPSGGIPSGTVNFIIDNGTPTPKTLGADGKATLQLSNLSIGNHTVVVNYVQSDNFTASSGTLTGGQTVNRAATMTAVTSSLNPSIFSQAVTFTATVSSATGTPTGMVNFIIDNGTPTPKTLDAMGKATLMVSNLSAGNHTVVVNYVQSDNFAASSGTLAGGQTVSQAATTTTVASSLNPSNLGQAVTFTARVNSLGGTPGGMVNFVIDNGTPTPKTLDNTGQATLMVSNLTGGNHTVRVDYVGAGNFAASSGTLTGGQTVNKTDTTAAVAFSPSAPIFGGDITFTATITSTAGIPTGTVNFVIDNGTPTPKTLGADGKATLVISTLTGGSHTVRVDYLGDASFNASTATLAGGLTVSKAASTTTLSATPDPLLVGQAAVLTARVAAVGTTPLPPGGTVTFFDNGTQLGTPVTLTGGAASFTTSPLTTGPHLFTATYNGDINFNTSTGTLPNRIVTLVPTSIALTSSLNPARPGQNVTFTAVITPSTPSTFTPSGTVTFFDNGTQLGTPVTLGANNTATFITSTLAVGQHVITATYNGDTNFNTSTSSALAQVTRSAALFAVGAAPGRVRVLRTSNGSLVADFAPFGSSYTGPVNVALGDVSGTGFEDLVVAAGAGAPHVKVFDGRALANGSFNQANPDANALASFFAYGTQFQIGATVAVGYVSGTTFADIITGAAAGNPHVKVYSGQAVANGSFNQANPDANLLASFFAYTLGQNYGVNVAAGDVTHAGFADVVTAPTKGNPDVKVYNGQAVARQTFNSLAPDASLRAEFMAFGTTFGIGAFVAVGDTTGFGFGDLIVGASSGNPQVKVFSGRAISDNSFQPGNPDANVLDQFFAYDSTFHGGVTVGAADFEGTGRFDILTGAAAGAPHYRVVSGTATGTKPPTVKGIEDIPSDLQGGVAVGAA